MIIDNMSDMVVLQKRKKPCTISNAMTLQILNYEFLGPINLSEWGPPMEEVLYLILSKTSETFSIIYAGQSGKTDDGQFFTKHERFQCWSQLSGQKNLHLAIYPMWGSTEQQRLNILKKIIQKYTPKCNESEPNVL